MQDEPNLPKETDPKAQPGEVRDPEWEARRQRFFPDYQSERRHMSIFGPDGKLIPPPEHLPR